MALGRMRQSSGFRPCQRKWSAGGSDFEIGVLRGWRRRGGWQKWGVAAVESFLVDLKQEIGFSLGCLSCDVVGLRFADQWTCVVGYNPSCAVA